jgi:hypothetical protein
VDRRDDRFAGDLRVAVRHRDGLLLVHARQQLGPFVAAVVQQRFVQAAEARARVHRYVIDVETLDDVDHDVGSRVGDEVARFFRGRVGVDGGLLACEPLIRRRHRLALVGGRGLRSGRLGGRECDACE